MNLKLVKSSIFFLGLILAFVFVSCNNKQKINVQNVVKVDSTKEKLVRINRYLTKKDALRIENYAKRRNWNVKLDSGGYYYEILTPGTGDFAQDNDIVTIAYQLSLLEGILCYSSDSSGLIRFEIGHAQLFSGIDDGIKKLKKGGKARFIFPPFWAFGLIGDQKCVPARAIIVYEVEIVELEKSAIH